MDEKLPYEGFVHTNLQLELTNEYIPNRENFHIQHVYSVLRQPESPWLVLNRLYELITFASKRQISLTCIIESFPCIKIPTKVCVGFYIFTAETLISTPSCTAPVTFSCLKNKTPMFPLSVCTLRI
uniref:Uncharacterized protein n=1 Tax=Cacopsylla melanoneura TaxID=428564 RepID=A0A8D9BUD5_9HEMI